eukprot:Phypoly_transcript_01922.p1 GENE.Phypoly_transcript_01922~~Phypoly_transcript_01922.p1  ORF type:complete len:959 (+),score=104.66 Phypoly_transcript_01922:166-3042(+)
MASQISRATQEIVSQHQLEQIVSALFPQENILSNVHSEANLINPKTGRHLELDLWIPRLELCFEFQDDYHYATTWYSHIPLEATKEGDYLKRHSVQQKGITHIFVPYWWDVTQESLAATVCFERPDLAPLMRVDPAPPIPFNPPFVEQEIEDIVPGVGELMYASFPPAVSLSITLQPREWWIGEKYDGLRACWNPADRSLYTKTGVPLDIPETYVRSAPGIFLDCETWFGRGTFFYSQRLLKTHEINWTNYRLIAFDKPDFISQRLSFEKRYRFLVRYVAFDHPFVILATRFLYLSHRLVTQLLGQIISDGGEGIIVRKVSSIYIHARSTLLWKLKATRGDMEALVVSVESANMYTLQMPDGSEFQAPYQHSSHESLPKKGDVVTFTFENFSNRSLPINPEISRVREDLTWRDVLRLHANSTSANSQRLSERSKKVVKPDLKPYGEWNPAKRAEVRNFFENIAKKRKLDPLVAKTWYTLTSNLVVQKEGKYYINQLFGSSYVKALMQIFPSIGLKETKFKFTPREYWNVARKRELFCQYAKQHSFDPLVASNWHSISVYSILVYKSIRSVLEQHSGSLSKALLHIFPDIGLDEKLLPKMPDKFWYGIDYQKNLVRYSTINASNIPHNSELDFSQDTIPLLQRIVPHSKRFWAKVHNQREFFDAFAKRLEFDPLVPTHWYRIVAYNVHSFLGGSAILTHYESLPQALMTVYPNIGLLPHKFLRIPRSYWEVKKNQLKFFDEYAKEKNFDPLVAENWYLVSVEDLSKISAARAILHYYGDSFVKAVSTLYPNVSFESSKFAPLKEKWKNDALRRAYFVAYAEARGFDPLVPENWYSINSKSILKWKTSNVLAAYDGSLANALMHLFPDIGLDRTKFPKMPKLHWYQAGNRRNFFENFAKRRKFDPLDPTKWYSVAIDSVLAMKKGSSVLSYYQQDLRKALLDVFPEIGLDPAKISFRRKI